MTQDSVPLRCQKEIGGTGASHTAKLLNVCPVLNNYHKTGDSSVGCTVHQFIYYIRAVYAIMGKCRTFIIHHDRNRALVSKAFVNPLIGQLTAVHSIPNLFLRGCFFPAFFQRLRSGNRFPAKSLSGILCCTICLQAFRVGDPGCVFRYILFTAAGQHSCRNQDSEQ